MADTATGEMPSGSIRRAYQQQCLTDTDRHDRTLAPWADQPPPDTDDREGEAERGPPGEIEKENKAGSNHHDIALFISHEPLQVTNMPDWSLVLRAEIRDSIDRSRRVFCRCVQTRCADKFLLGDAGESVPLLGKQRLDPIDYRAHAGGAAPVRCRGEPA